MNDVMIAHNVFPRVYSSIVQIKTRGSEFGKWKRVCYSGCEKNLHRVVDNFRFGLSLVELPQFFSNLVFRSSLGQVAICRIDSLLPLDEASYSR